MNRRHLAQLAVLALFQQGLTAPLAFPGALGFGSGATGGRAGKVYHVTNLNDTGAGSFRAAVGTSNRVVVFDVGGTITLKTAVSAKSNLTIAGQTAPGDGIAFRGGEISFAKQSNIIMRHVRIRPGSETASSEDDALSLYLAENAILDHCSFEFAPWNNIDGVGTSTDKVTNISFQHCLIADPTGQQFGAHCESVESDWSWYYNAFVNSHNRNPLAKTNTVFVNNVEYNNEASYTTHTSTNFSHDIVNNYFLYGPATSGNTWFQVDKNQSIYYSGNLQDSNKDGLLGGSTTTPYWYQGEGTVLTKPWSPVTDTNPVLSTATAFRLVTSQSGTLPYDQLDSLIWNQVKTLGKGSAGPGAGTAGPSSLYTSQTQTGLPNNGYGITNGGTKPVDTDNDGMPDFWEKALGYDTAKDDAMTLGADGYARIEGYLNWLADPHARTKKNTSVDLDLRTWTQGFQSVSPTYVAGPAVNGSATLLADGHTLRFVPATNVTGTGSVQYTVKGTDGSSYTGTVAMLIEPSAVVLKPVTYVWNIDTTVAVKTWSTAANWTPSAVPTDNDTAIIRSGEVQISQDIGAVVKVESKGTFRTLGSGSVDDLRLQGGVLKSYTSNPLFALTVGSLAVESPSTVMAGSQAASVFQLEAALKGTGDLTKTGPGVLQLGKSSPSFAGAWTVSEGTLRLKAPKAVGTGKVAVNPGAVLSLDTAGSLRSASSLALLTDGTLKAALLLNAKDTVNQLVLGGTTAAVGTYTATTSPSWMSGTGSLTVLTGPSVGLTESVKSTPGYALSPSSRVVGASTPIAWHATETGAVLSLRDLSGKLLARLPLAGTQGSVRFGSLAGSASGSLLLTLESRGAVRTATVVFSPR